jgi:hypothetical protein
MLISKRERKKKRVEAGYKIYIQLKYENKKLYERDK